MHPLEFATPFFKQARTNIFYSYENSNQAI